MRPSAREIIAYFAVKNGGDWDSIMNSISTKKDIDENELQEVVKGIKHPFITIMDSEYPECLKQVFKPPFILFYEGNISLLYKYGNNLAVVGSREPSEYGGEYCKKLIKDIALDFTIVSGLAKGIDSIAHQAAIENLGATIAIVANGLNYFYPSENKELQKQIADNYLLLSEYPDDIPPKPENFVTRNRIVVGLSKGLMFFDLKENSGTLSSVNKACQYGKNVMSIPYPIGMGYINNKLIGQGAALVETGDDIRFEMKGY